MLSLTTRNRDLTIAGALQTKPWDNEANHWTTDRTSAYTVGTHALSGGLFSIGAPETSPFLVGKIPATRRGTTKGRMTTIF